MAVLTANDLVNIRQGYSANNAVAYQKGTLNTAVQAIEDWFEANRASLSTAINAATAPTVLTAPEKKALAAIWLHNKFGRGG